MPFTGMSIGPGSSADMIIIAGQSNAVGGNFDTTGQSLLAANASYAVPVNNNIQTWTANNGNPWVVGSSTGNFRPLRNGWNNANLIYQQAPDSSSSFQNWGPGMQCSYLYSQAFPNRTLFIVQTAVSGTPLYSGGAGQNWDPNTVGVNSLFGATEEMYNAAKNSLGSLNPRVLAVLWMQGEADATDTNAATAYGANLTALIAAARTRWGLSGNRFILGKIRDNYSFSSQVRSAQAAAASPNVKVINTDAYGMQGDNVHYTAAGQISLGADMYAGLA